MQLLGSYRVNVIEQRQLTDGCAIALPFNRLPPGVLCRARIGDLFWLKEPWALISSRVHGKQGIREAVPGPAGTPMPLHLRRYEGLRMQPLDAVSLSRGDSRITLEIMGISEHAVRVLVHFCQVDRFMRERRTQ